MPGRCRSSAQPSDRVLEIGFGPGIAVRELARRATHGKVLGIDRSAVMRAQAARRYTAAIRAGRVSLDVGRQQHGNVV
jgi:ubiquinone/menaquinone biosynthesis C-methylase UbiE